VLATNFQVPRRLPESKFWSLCDYLQHRRLEPDARLFATPSDQLVLTFYTGLPVQSTAPVRKSFFDTYPKRILVVEPVFEALQENDPAVPGAVLRVAERNGASLTPAAAEHLSAEIASYDYRRTAETHVRSVRPPVEPLPDFAASLLDRQRRVNQERWAAELRKAEVIPLTRGFGGNNEVDIWCTFFYRFVDPDAHRGPNLNYAARVANSDLTVIGGAWAVYDSPGPAGGPVPGESSSAAARRSRRRPIPLE
jgi:hypothetical protein